MKELLNKLSKAKAEITPIVKNETNPFFKSKYCDINALLAEIEPILHAHNLLLLQPIENNTVSTKIYDIESGQVIESSMTLPDLQDPQKMGSAVTYYRRYTCVSLLGLQAIDTDGNLTPKPVTKTPNPQPKIKPVKGKPRLTDDGYDFLMNKGTIDQINEALENRQMGIVQENKLKAKLEHLKTKIK